MDQHAAAPAARVRQPGRAPGGTAGGPYRTVCDETATRTQGFSHTAARTGTGGKSPERLGSAVRGRLSPYPLLDVFSGKADIVLRRPVQPADLRLRQRAYDLRRAAEHERAGRDLTARGHHRSRADQALFADLRTVEDDRAHADQRKRVNRAGVHDHVMRDRYAVPQDRGHPAAEDVDRGIILDVHPRADTDVADIAAHYRVEPDTRLRTDVHIADDVGALLDI